MSPDQQKLRQDCLQLSLANGHNQTDEEILARAAKYLKFINGDDPGQKDSEPVKLSAAA